MKSLFLIVVFVSCSATSLFAQHFTTTKDFDKAYALLLDLKFEEAEKHIQAIRIKDEQNLAVVYLEDLSDFLYIVVKENENEFERRKEFKQSRLNIIERLPANSPERLLTEGEIHLHWAFSSMRFGEYFSAANGINKAFNSLEKSIKKHPDFLPSYKSMGLLHTLIGTVPDNYKWATKLMGVDGTIEQGITEMQLVLTQSNDKPALSNLRKETLFLLTFLNINLLNDKPALLAFRKDIENESGPLMDFALVSILNEQDSVEAAINLLESSSESLEAFSYLNYLLGEMKLARLDSNANELLKTYLASFKGTSYKKAAQQKLAWFELLVNRNKRGYWEEIEKIDDLPSTILDEDKSAQKEFESETIPNSILLKARLQFDGGFYREALKTLISSKQSDLTTKDEELEFTYRLARIHHQLGNSKDAISYYKMTMKMGKNSKRYFAANSALQLGLLYEESGNKEDALSAFNACSEFSNSEYRNSITQKAKAGILRVQN